MGFSSVVKKSARGLGRVGVLLTLACVAFASAGITPGTADGAGLRVRDVEIKAAYLYNFLLFAEWPEGARAGESARGFGPYAASGVHRVVSEQAGSQTVIGIVGEDPFGDSFAEVEGKYDEALGSKLVIVRFGSYREGMTLTRCHLLFVTASERRNLPSILRAVEGRPVLTVGEAAGFLEKGGMINLLVKRQKLRWEINYAAANEARIQLNSQLLRNAVRVIENGEG